MKSQVRMMCIVKRAVMAGAICASVAGCGASTQLVNVWKDPAQPAPVRNVFVVDLSNDPARRRIWEDAFVSELERRGVDAAPSYRAFPDALPDTAQIVSTVRRAGYDGVIMATRLPTQTQRHYVPGYVATFPVTRYNPWYDAYFMYYRDIYQPGYVETERVVTTRTDVWTTEGGGRMIWTGTSEVYDPSSGDDVRKDVVKRLVPELVKQGVIAGRA